jgi:hypothetical protein
MWSLIVVVLRTVLVRCCVAVSWHGLTARVAGVEDYELEQVACRVWSCGEVSGWVVAELGQEIACS